MQNAKFKVSVQSVGCSSREQSGLGFRAVKVKPDLTLSSDQQCPVPNCFTQCPVLVVPSAQNIHCSVCSAQNAQCTKCQVHNCRNAQLKCAYGVQVPKMHVVPMFPSAQVAHSVLGCAHCPSFAGCTNMVPKLGGEQKYAPFTASARAALLLKQSNINPEICLAVFSVFSDWKISKY